jgi:hypothetical protein
MAQRRQQLTAPKGDSKKNLRAMTAALRLTHETPLSANYS